MKFLFEIPFLEIDIPIENEHNIFETIQKFEKPFLSRIGTTSWFDRVIYRKELQSIIIKVQQTSAKSGNYNNVNHNNQCLKNK